MIKHFLCKLMVITICCTTLFCGSGSGSVTLDFGEVDLDLGTMEILIENLNPVAGFQFHLTGVTILGCSGGLANAHGFSLLHSDSVAIGYYQGIAIPAGSGVLLEVTFVPEVDATESCLLDAVVSDEGADGYAVTLGDCVSLIPTGVESDLTRRSFMLYQSRPNPSSKNVTIWFNIPEGGSKVTLDIFSVDGRKVASLLDGFVEAGRHPISWSGMNDKGVPVAAGVYFYRLKTPTYERTLKMIISP